MYYYLENGKQCLDLKGTLIISFNDELVKARLKSVAPSIIKAPDGFIKNVGKAKFLRRIFITFRVIAFIWGRDKQLKREDTNFRESHRANVANELKTPKVSGKIIKMPDPVVKCPVCDVECKHYIYQLDNFGEVAIEHCKHPKNPTEGEGNCNNYSCPHLVQNNHLL